MAIPLCIFVGLCAMLSIVSGEHLPEECKIAWPTRYPTTAPTNSPTQSPTNPTSEPTNPTTTNSPTQSPTNPTSEPTNPTQAPTDSPTTGQITTPAPTNEPTASVARKKGRKKEKTRKTRSISKHTPSPIEQVSGQQNGWKWNLIHPEYNGTYGEILWQVYCGDLRSNHRFDNFRKKKLWDVKVIEDELLPYFQENDETKNAEKSQAVIDDIRNGSSSSKHYGLWVFLLCLFGLVFIGYFAYKAKYKEMHRTEIDECEPLLNLDTIRYDC